MGDNWESIYFLLFLFIAFIKIANLVVQNFKNLMVNYSAPYQYIKVIASAGQRSLREDGRIFKKAYDVLTFGKVVHAADSPMHIESLLTEAQYNLDRRYYVNKMKNKFTALRIKMGHNPANLTNRKKIVIVGTGWANMHFIPHIDVTKYDVTVVSPRNYFTFTPLLPSVCSGALEARSCMEFIQPFTMRGGKKVMKFYEARAEDVDFENNTMTCQSPDGHKFVVPYDYLLLGVGAQTNTFGIKGVAENAFFLKEVENASSVHRRLISNMEAASVPGVSDDEIKRLLHVVVVGAGPAGVEAAAEIADFVKHETRKYYPAIADKLTVSLIEMLPKVLAAFSLEGLSDYVLENFKKLSIDTLLRTRVAEVDDKVVKVATPDGSLKELPYGMLLWCSGVGQIPFVKDMMQKIPAQKENRVLTVNEKLQVIGVKKHNVYAMGDCSYLMPQKLADHVDELYELAKKSSHGAGISFLKNNRAPLMNRFCQLSPDKMHVMGSKDHLSKDDFKTLLDEIDKMYRPPVPTAQNAKQAGYHLSTVFNDFDMTDYEKLPAFVEKWRGSMAYVGGGNAVAHTPLFNVLGGWHSSSIWKALYWSMQMSAHNRLLLLFDWMKVLINGRNIGTANMEDKTLRPT